MKRFLLFSLAVTLSIGIVWAQSKKSKPEKANTDASTRLKQSAKYKFKASPVYLGNSDLRQGVVPKYVFDSLMAQGLTAKDSAGTAGTVTQFRIYYKERNLYEDSLGNYYTDVEMLTDLSKSNKLNSYVALSNRTKKGDTAIFDDIVVMLPDSIMVQGLGMKIVIGK
ncbi:MAG: hypothetical protein QM530_10245 [Phycisphaerales bacterium]|nr:hypothetical protein [Phycisphaerales bacterium]